MTRAAFAAALAQSANGTQPAGAQAVSFYEVVGGEVLSTANEADPSNPGSSLVDYSDPEAGPVAFSVAPLHWLWCAAGDGHVACGRV